MSVLCGICCVHLICSVNSSSQKTVPRLSLTVPFLFAFFEFSAQRCQSCLELGHGINSWCHFGCVTNHPASVAQQGALVISRCLQVSAAHPPQPLTDGSAVGSPVTSPGGSASSAPGARLLLGCRSRSHGQFSSKRASWEGGCECVHTGEQS